MSAKKRNPEITSKIMSCIRSKNTRPEIQLGKMLWLCGARYRKHYKIIGRPDFVFVSKRIAIFVDGDFWHGHNWKLRGLKTLDEELATYKEFWVKKIKNNVKRDVIVNKALKNDNWKVIRIWESDLKNNPTKAIKKILRIYESIKPCPVD